MKSKDKTLVDRLLEARQDGHKAGIEEVVDEINKAHSLRDNPKGFFITNGSAPQPISHDNARPIRKWVDAIQVTNETNIAGRAINNGFAWSVGNLTVDSQNYPNVELRYNRILNQWSVRTYPTKFTVYASYLDGQGRNVTVAGDNDGQVIELDRPDRFVDYVTISGEPGEVAINFDIRTHQEKHGLNQLKLLSDKFIYLFHS